MSIITIFAILIGVAVAVWIIQQAGWPQPITWGAYGILFIIALVIILNVSGINLGSVR
jgi:hypothetical protein